MNTEAKRDRLQARIAEGSNATTQTYECGREYHCEEAEKLWEIRINTRLDAVKKLERNDLRYWEHVKSCNKMGRANRDGQWAVPRGW